MAWTITIDRAYFTGEAPTGNETYGKKYLNLKGFNISSNSGDTAVDDRLQVLLQGMQVVSQPYTSNFNSGTNSFSNNLPYHSSDYDADTDYLLLGNKAGHYQSPGNANNYSVSITAGVDVDLKLDLDPLLTDNYMAGGSDNGTSNAGYQGFYKGYASTSQDEFKVANFTKAGNSNKSVTSLYIANNSGLSIGQSVGWLMDSTKSDMVAARNSWKLARSLSSLTLTIGMNNVWKYLGTDPDSFSGISFLDEPDQVIYAYSTGNARPSSSGHGPKLWTASGSVWVPLSITQLKSANASSVATQLIDEFDMTYAGDISCDVDTFSNITTAQTNTLKRRYSALAAAGGDSDYVTLRSDTESATTVTEHALESSKVIGQDLSDYTSGLKQYKLVVDASEFDLTGNAVLNSITTRLESMLRRELINLSSGIGDLNTSSVTTAITNNTTPAIDETVNKTCIQALITESSTTTVDRPAGVFGGDVQKFIQEAGEASDGGEHIATMLNNLKSAGTSGATSMIHVNGSTLNIGIRRVVCGTSNPNNNTNFVGSALHSAVNSITEKLMLAAKTMIRTELLNSDL